MIQTRFLLYSRAKREYPESLRYGDDFKSIFRSGFDPTKTLKVIIHGYKGSGSDAGAILLAQTFLDVVSNAKCKYLFCSELIEL